MAMKGLQSPKSLRLFGVRMAAVPVIVLALALGPAASGQAHAEGPAAEAEQPPLTSQEEGSAALTPDAEAGLVKEAEVEPGSVSLGTGIASFYADRFHGRRTASGERFDNRAFTAAHRTLPFGSRVRVTNPATGASVIVRITDRGPFTHNRTIDVSRAAAEQLGLVRAGHGPVVLELLEGEA